MNNSGTNESKRGTTISSTMHVWNRIDSISQCTRMVLIFICVPYSESMLDRCVEWRQIEIQ